jgi:hypothetical protein
MRWKQWRLVEYDDGWRLLDLKADPKEERDLAKEHSESSFICGNDTMHGLPHFRPVIPLGKGEGEGGGPTTQGYGWATDAD